MVIRAFFRTDLIIVAPAPKLAWSCVELQYKEVKPLGSQPIIFPLSSGASNFFFVSFVILVV
jgi:hypothetical protein